MSRPFRILLLKPFQPVTPQICCPPLGILYLISSLRQRFGRDVAADYWDCRLFCEPPEKFAARIAGRYDLVGISALNFEADVSHRLAHAVKALSPHTLTALGGPYAHSSPESIRNRGGFDWIFDGESERTFADAVEKSISGAREFGGIPGLTWRPSSDASYVDNGGEDSIPDLDSIPMPAWDLVPFDVYAKRINLNGPLKARRYAPLFTSRGCPYKCHYCHDIFGKSYRWRSAENVMEELDLLVRTYGVGEFQIIDDIYNLHKPRMRTIARSIIERYGARKLHFCFPNGVRGDIFSVEDLPLLREMGVYKMSVAIETVTPRLQKLIDKNLDLDRARLTIEAAAAIGIVVRAFFMIGFPTETVEEIENTVRFALSLPLTFASFLPVIPQEGTPLHDLAERENSQALADVAFHDFFAEKPWYQRAYGVDTPRIMRQALRRFFLRPAVVARLVRGVPEYLLGGGWIFLKLSFMPPAFRAGFDRQTQRGNAARAEALRLELSSRAATAG